MIMNAKFYVPFETAKILKERGYPEYTDIFYDANGCLANTFARSNYDAPIVLPVIAAPTYHEVVDWLEEKGIYITCYAPLLKPVDRYGISVFNSNTDNTNDLGLCREAYPTREDALNAGILKALEMI